MNRLETWFMEKGKKILMVLLWVLGAYLFFKYLLSYTAPFVVAWIVAFMLQWIVNILDKKLKMQRGIATMLSMVTVLSAFSWIITILMRKFFTQVNNLYQRIPEFRDQLLETFNIISDKTQHLFSALPFNSTISLERSVDQLFQNLASFLGSFLSRGSINIVSKLPNFLFFTIVTLLSIFFMTRDYPKIQKFINAQIPTHMTQKMSVLKNDLLSALWGYVRTQLILMCFTMTICIIGFLIFRVKNPIILGMVIAVVDALPMFGSGAFLIPWAVYNVIIGEYSMALGLGGIYALIVVVRQTMEPRVLSNQIGVYTLVTLMAMYIGFKLIGVFGLIIGPIVVIVIQTLQSVGLLPSFKEVE